ncbi:MAG: hypothetical protein P4M10_08985 [Verrucomicrobiae bacterium]|nr:hypothetical protein [Verrucomicrobiae bacterium]
MKIKIALSILLGLVILGVIALLIVGARLGDIAKAAMETVGPKITQTTLTVDHVSVSLLAGSAGVKGLVVGNPQGYQAAQSISVGSASVSLEPRSVLGDKIVIHAIAIQAPEITFEGNPFGENNLTKIMANANGPGAASATNAPATSPAGKKAGKKLEVDDLLISGAKVHAHLTGLVNREITVPLPDIHMTDLGKGPDGITAGELTQKVLSAITTQTIETLGTTATDLAKGVAKDLKGALLNTTNVTGGVDKLKKGLGGLFNK